MVPEMTPVLALIFRAGGWPEMLQLVAEESGLVTASEVMMAPSLLF